MEKGIAQGRRDDLVGGGLIRSAGGWAAVKSFRKAGIFQKNDERILGDGGFVERVLSRANEDLDRRCRIRAQGLTFESILDRVQELTSVDPELILSKDRQRETVRARSLACCLAAGDWSETGNDSSGGEHCNTSRQTIRSGIGVSLRVIYIFMYDHRRHFTGADPKSRVAQPNRYVFC